MRLLLKASQAVFVASVSRRQELERDAAIEQLVFGEIDLTHTTSANWPDDFVMTDGLSLRQFGLASCQQTRRCLNRRLFNEAQPLLVCCNERLNLISQFRIACAGALHK